MKFALFFECEAVLYRRPEAVELRSTQSSPFKVPHEWTFRSSVNTEPGKLVVVEARSGWYCINSWHQVTVQSLMWKVIQTTSCFSAKYWLHVNYLVNEFSLGSDVGIKETWTRVCAVCSDIQCLLHLCSGVFHFSSSFCFLHSPPQSFIFLCLRLNGL